MRLVVALAAMTVALAVVVLAQGTGLFRESRDHPTIAYSTGPVSDAAEKLNRQLQQGVVELTFEPTSGYLRSVLDALRIPVESQALVFSKTALQAHRINPRNPRAVFFADSVAVGWVRGGNALEVAAHDPRQGVVFYTLDQEPASRPQLRRNDNCLACHLAWATLGVPGLLMLTTFPMPEDDQYAYAMGGFSDHRRPFVERWGGWYVTGNPGRARHFGNLFVQPENEPDMTGSDVAVQLASVDGQFDTEGYLSLHSDIVALMVLEHQAYLTNLITKIGWETRLALYEQDASGRIGDVAPRETAATFVDYLLFVDEASLPGPIRGSSGFAEAFVAQGPSDRLGRSLREFDLERRLMRYPCSYMIYTEAFDALPPPAKSAIYQRMWQILSGEAGEERYSTLSLADRQAVVEILRDTKEDLPEYFQPVLR
jgi:hypothetical protein